MATGEANICNKALIKLGERSNFLDDLATDQNEEAAVFREIYEDQRNICLAAFPWPFATLRVALARIDTAVEPTREGWDYVYQLPNDCLTAREIWESGERKRVLRATERIPFTIEKSSVDDTQVLLCDLIAPVLRYTVPVVDPTRYPPLFVEALAYLLAAEAAQALTGKEAKEDVMRKWYRLKIQEAQVAALNGVQEDEAPESETISGRR